MFNRKPITTPILMPKQEQIDAYAEIKQTLSTLESHRIPATKTALSATSTCLFAVYAVLRGTMLIGENARIASVRDQAFENLENPWHNLPVQEYTREGWGNTTCANYFGPLSKLEKDCKVIIYPEDFSKLRDIYQGMQACFRLAYDYAVTCNTAKTVETLNNISFAFAILITAISLGSTIFIAHSRQQENKKINSRPVVEVISKAERAQLDSLITKVQLNIDQHTSLSEAIATLQQIKTAIEHNPSSAPAPIRP